MDNEYVDDLIIDKSNYVLNKVKSESRLDTTTRDASNYESPGGFSFKNPSNSVQNLNIGLP